MGTVAKCHCGRRFSSLEWAELGMLESDYRNCPCGLLVKLEKNPGQLEADLGLLKAVLALDVEDDS